VSCRGMVVGWPDLVTPDSPVNTPDASGGK
jgi:hypothetical protein